MHENASDRATDVYDKADAEREFVRFDQPADSEEPVSDRLPGVTIIDDGPEAFEETLRLL